MTILVSGCGEVASKGGQANPESETITYEQLAWIAQQRGWEIDTSLDTHRQAMASTGLHHPRPTTQDEVLDYAHRAWGLPRRATGKTLRRAFLQENRVIDPTQSLAWVDQLGYAGQICGVPPKRILQIHGYERDRFDALGMSFDDGVALIAGMAMCEPDDLRLARLVRQVDEALLDVQVRTSLEYHGVCTRCGTGFDLLSQIDLAQRRYPHGPLREAFFDESIPPQWREGMRVAMDGRSRRVSCNLAGQMRCARGATLMKMETLPKDGSPGNGTEYYKAQAILEIMGRTIDR